MTSKRTISAGLGFRFRDLLGKIDIEESDPITFKELQKTEWSPDFEEICRHLLIMGALRHGRLNSPGKKQYKRTAEIRRRSELYDTTGNLEYLADISNLSMLEFEEGIHPKRHFKSTGDEQHTEAI